MSKALNLAIDISMNLAYPWRYKGCACWNVMYLADTFLKLVTHILIDGKRTILMKCYHRQWSL